MIENCNRFYNILDKMAVHGDDLLRLVCRAIRKKLLK